MLVSLQCECSITNWSIVLNIFSHAFFFFSLCESVSKISHFMIRQSFGFENDLSTDREVVNKFKPLITIKLCISFCLINKNINQGQWESEIMQLFFTIVIYSWINSIYILWRTYWRFRGLCQVVLIKSLR